MEKVEARFFIGKKIDGS